MKLFSRITKAIRSDIGWFFGLALILCVVATWAFVIGTTAIMFIYTLRAPQ